MDREESQRIGVGDEILPFQRAGTAQKQRNASRGGTSRVFAGPPPAGALALAPALLVPLLCAGAERRRPPSASRRPWLRKRSSRRRYGEAAHAGQSVVVDEAHEHFACFIERSGQLVELDGHKAATIAHVARLGRFARRAGLCKRPARTHASAHAQGACLCASACASAHGMFAHVHTARALCAVLIECARACPHTLRCIILSSKAPESARQMPLSALSKQALVLCRSETFGSRFPSSAAGTANTFQSFYSPRRRHERERRH